MKPVFRLVMLTLLLLIMVSNSTVWAHGGEEEEVVDAPTLVRQAIAFLEGGENTEAAATLIMKALKSGNGQIILEKLEKAKLALEAGELEKSKNALVMALGKDPQSAEELGIHPSFSAGVTGYGLVFLSLVLISGGLLVLQKSRKEGVGK